MLIQTDDQFFEACMVIVDSPIITCDTETNWTSIREDQRIMGIAVLAPVGDSYNTYYFPFRHEHDETLFQVENLPLNKLDDLIDLLTKKLTVWHNAKFDLRMLENEGIKVDHLHFYDTMLLSWMENEEKYSHGLFELGKLVGSKKLGKELDNIAKHLGSGSKEVGWQKVPPDVMGKYAEQDVILTWELFKLFWPRIQEQGLDELYGREVKISHLLRRIEDRGVLIDLPLAKQYAAEAQSRQEELLQLLGFDPGKPSQLAHRLYALPEHGGLGFRPLGFSSRKSKEFKYLPIMDDDVLSRLNHEVVDQVREFRQLVKAKSTWYDGWVNHTDRYGRLHPNFKQHGTKTTRLSCENPNLQQVPRQGKVKSLLRAPVGYELWEFDYSQVEFRLGSVYAECESILGAYREGFDVHSMTAKNIGAYEKFPDDPDTARYVGKQTNFLTIYGGGAGVLQKQLWRDAKLDVPEKECKKMLEQFHTAYPEFRDITYRCQSAVEQTGYVKYWNGRRRHFSNSYDYHKAFNSLIQGGAAQIMLESMLELDAAGFKIVAQVHDSVWIELPVGSIEESSEKIKEIMSWPTESFDCPFPVDGKCLFKHTTESELV